jgi:hypothetical protein
MCSLHQPYNVLCSTKLLDLPIVQACDLLLCAFVLSSACVSAETTPRVSQCGGWLQSEAVSGVSLPEGHYDTVAGYEYELRELPGRRLRRWPRGARRDSSPPTRQLWDVLEPYRWPWDD